MHQELLGYKVEEKLYVGVREQRNVEYHWSRGRIGVAWRQWTVKRTVLCALLFL